MDLADTQEFEFGRWIGSAFADPFWKMANESPNAWRMNILIFEDSQVSRLYPITTGRPAMAVNCASFRLVDLVPHFLSGPIAASVRPHLRAHLRMDFPGIGETLRSDEPWTICLNARLVPSLANMQRLARLAAAPAPLVLAGGAGTVAAAIVATDSFEQLLASSGQSAAEVVDQLGRELEPDGSLMDLFDFPHDVVRFNQRIFDESLAFRLARGAYREIADGVFVSGSVAISDFVVTNTKSGPILIEDDTAIGPFCFLRGPLHIGARSRINEHSAIKDFVALGHTTKIGGEVESSVIEAFTNKQHHGFLGHSYLGSWINLGAGTCNSDLKNTYGEVKMDYSGERVSSGMQFLGCVIGDYSKTAINTSIFTGKTIGVCSMVYGFVTTNVPSFVNYARSFGQVTEMPPGVMEATQRRMFARRNVQQRPLDSELIAAMHQLTQKERQMSEEPLSL